MRTVLKRVLEWRWKTATSQNLLVGLDVGHLQVSKREHFGNERSFVHYNYQLNMYSLGLLNNCYLLFSCCFDMSHIVMLFKKGKLDLNNLIYDRLDQNNPNFYFEF